MKFQTGFLVLGLFLSQANAAPIRSPSALEAEVLRLKTKADELNGKITANNNQIDQIEINYQKALRERDAATTTVETCSSSTVRNWFSDGCSTKVNVPENLATAFTAAETERKKIAELQAKNNEVRSELRTVNADLGTARIQSNNLTAEQKDQLSNVTSLVANLKADLNAQNLDLLQNNQILDQISNTYDKAVLGVYIRDKMGQLLASQAFCDAQRSCGSTRDATAIQRAVRLELFPSQAVGSRQSAKPATPVKPAGAK